MPKKNDPLDDYQKIKNEMVVDQVNEVLRNHPDKYIEKLEEIGFQYFEEEDAEQIEEDNAVPENDRQKRLVLYFEGTDAYSNVKKVRGSGLKFSTSAPFYLYFIISKPIFCYLHPDLNLKL